MNQKMNYRGFKIKIWGGKGGIGANEKSYLAQTVSSPVITVRRNSVSQLRDAIKFEIDRRYSK